MTPIVGMESINPSYSVGGITIILLGVILFYMPSREFKIHFSDYLVIGTKGGIVTAALYAIMFVIALYGQTSINVFFEFVITAFRNVNKLSLAILFIPGFIGGMFTYYIDPHHLIGDTDIGYRLHIIKYLAVIPFLFFVFISFSLPTAVHVVDSIKQLLDIGQTQPDPAFTLQALIQLPVVNDIVIVLMGLAALSVIIPFSTITGYITGHVYMMLVVYKEKYNQKKSTNSQSHDETTDSDTGTGTDSSE